MSEGIRKINEYVLKEARTLITNDTNGILETNGFELGTLYYHNSNENDQYILSIKNNLNPTVWSRIPIYSLLENKSISNLYIANKTITNQQIENSTIITALLKDLAITTEKINDNAVTSIKILNGSIVSEKIAESAIIAEKIAANAVTTVKIIDGAITSSKIANNSINLNKFIIDDNSISGSKLINLSINTDKIDNLAITNAKLGERSITSNKIAYSGVIAENIADLNVTTDKLANFSVTTAKLANLSVSTDKLITSSVTTEKIASLAITNAKIGAGVISIDKLDTGVQNSINTSIKLLPNGIAYCYGSLNVTGNIAAGGTIDANKVFHAVYNDLAEGYVPGEHVLPGDIVEVREDNKIYKATAFSKQIVGVVSDEFAVCYGASEEEIRLGKKIAIGLIGKVHVKIYGPVKIGDYIVSCGEGCGCVSSSASNGIIGKALQTVDNKGYHHVLCLIYPN